jgi:integrase/recombinase XerD
MTGFEARVNEYLGLRRAVGFKLARHGRLLPDFAGFLAQHGIDTVTVEAAMAWAAQPQDTSLVWIAERLSIVRGFARWLAALEPATEVPPPGLVPGGPRRPTPYLFSEAEIAALMSAARQDRHLLRAATLETFIGLLAVTGMRPSEAMKLDRDDLDRTHGLVTVRSAKFGKSRLVPLHPTTVAALDDYLAVRDRLSPRPANPALLVWSSGNRLGHSAIQPAFRRLLAQAGITASGSRRPRLHALRHSFAVRTLLGWYRDDLDVQALLPVLSTYLGHVDPGKTYWYYSDSRVIPMPVRLRA